MSLLNLLRSVAVDDCTEKRNYTSLSGFQMFSPTSATSQNRLRVPLEVLIDLRCESDEFERLVPQTDATFHYDKFNQLRLRNDITSEPSAHPSLDTTPSVSHTHLQDQTVWFFTGDPESLLTLLSGSHPDTYTAFHCFSKRQAFPDYI
jgi:hypothetical protein